MPLEIERKFLIKNNDFKKESFKQLHIIQGYLSRDPEKTIRVRIKGGVGFLTVKGMSNESGITRFEWETEILQKDAKILLELCGAAVIDKTRYYIKNGKHIFEVDDFHGDNEGLIIAEIELKTENEYFYMPKWLGKEITGDVRYYNSMLANNSFKSWKTK